jgi:hypothetical protein
MGTAILAISPLHLQYSQIVRTYSLLIAATLLSSAVLLLALRVPKRTNWWIYAFTVTLGFYSNVLFGFVVVGHALSLIFDAKGKITKAIQQYLLASLLGISLFLPWLYLFLTKPGLLGYSVEQVVEKESIGGLIQTWVRNIPRIFVDLNDSWVESSKPFLLLQRVSFPLLLVFLFVSLIFLIIKIEKNKHSMILSLIIAGGGLLMFKDAIVGGSFSTRLRYMLPYVIGWQLSAIAFIAYLLYSRSNWQQKLSKIILSSLLVLGLLSCVIIVQAPSWWSVGAPDYPAIAQKVNQLSKPIVLYDDFGDALTMSYLLQDNVDSHLTKRADFHLQNSLTDLYKGYSDIVIFKPPQNILEKLQNNRHLKLIPLFQSKGIFPDKPNAWKVLRL